MKKVLVIDNYDSFTYNLVHYLEKLGAGVTVVRNDETIPDDVAGFEKLLLSPGPGVPAEAGVLAQLIKEYAPVKSILGVCLGQQAIAEVFGGSLINLEMVHHGVASVIDIIAEDETLFAGLPKQIEVGRYHSWSVDPATLPPVLEVTSVDQEGRIMSLRHKIFDVKGVQFHPESVLTPHGLAILENWIKY
ncbi:aminodeoxychorismate/anthranilate synthase component II [Flavobacterium cyanobacteriorum]|uniref:Aminodeoxychorismate/anthranilate synthase component II n=1 Tax=Flavobacterium cyanobacteriorum TaxID=2022802 RepID=A0A255ZAB8_9FLAO|nr:aminodeoxychorismate/anthranilate synthase component II [Flavobacterium cyanobacteriorum]OYQ38382.1 aminodeoxychorismate/anthranilate synthase component II [Flavobacterium cyanobacteriorum]